MLLATHSLVGAFIGQEVGYPPLAFLLGIISHLLLDSIPHADGPDDKVGSKETDPVSFLQYAVVFIDIALGAIAIFYLISSGEIGQSAIWGAAGGIFPDFVDNVPFWSPKLRELFSPLKKFHLFHAKIQMKKLSVAGGLILQYAIAILFLVLIIAL